MVVLHVNLRQQKCKHNEGQNKILSQKLNKKMDREIFSEKCTQGF